MKINQNSTTFTFKGAWNYIKTFSILSNLKSISQSDKLIGFEILIIYFIGHFIRLSSTNEIFESENMQKISIKLFNRTFDVDTARYHLKKIANATKKFELYDIMNDFVKTLSRKKILQRECTYTCKNGKKYIPIGIDGSESYRTYCLNKIRKRKDHLCTGYSKADKHGIKHFFAKHTCSYLTTLFGNTKLILGFAVAGKQESHLDKNDCEKNLFIQLISNLRKATKINNLLIVGDAMYTDKNRMKECIDHNLCFLFTLKDGLKTLADETIYRLNLFNVKSKTYNIQVGRMEHHVSIRRIIIQDFIEGTLLYVYEFVDLDTNEKEMAVSNVDLPLKDAYKLKHIRWEEENIFNLLTKQCNITHNFIFDAKDLTTLLQVISYNMSVLYCKHYLKSCVILNGSENFKETMNHIKKSLFNMKNYNLLKTVIP